MNNAICNEVEARRHSYENLLGSGEEGLEWRLGLSAVKAHKFHILQPLFRALLLIVSRENYNNERSKDIGRIPVLLVRTGI